jgi:hypothetical protein
MAATAAAPELIPVSSPSSVARRRAMATASSLDTCKCECGMGGWLCPSICRRTN